MKDGQDAGELLLDLENNYNLKKIMHIKALAGGANWLPKVSRLLASMRKPEKIEYYSM